MKRCEIVLSGRQRRKLLFEVRRCGDGARRGRLMMILHSAAGWTAAAIARALGVCPKTVSRARWLAEGEAGLVDRREDNGDLKATEEYAAELREVPEKTAPEHGHRRPTWTRGSVRS